MITPTCNSCDRIMNTEAELDQSGTCKSCHGQIMAPESAAAARMPQDTCIVCEKGLDGAPVWILGEDNVTHPHCIDCAIKSGVFDKPQYHAGPWTALEVRPVVASNHLRTKSSEWLIIQDDDRMVRTTIAENIEKADAHLISTAPELYETLLSLITDLEAGQGCLTREVFKAYCRSVRAIIAKAEGRGK